MTVCEKNKKSYMFAPILSVSIISKKLLFFSVFLLLAFSGHGQKLSIKDVQEIEDVGTMVFEVTLDEDVPGGTTVSYSFIDLTTTGGVDYDNTIGPDLIFNGDKDEVQIISVPIIDDFVDEQNDEDFRVQLGTPTNGVDLDGGGVARGRIKDNDTAGINVSTTTGTTTEAGGQATFTFTLDTQPTAEVTIFFDQYDSTETTGPSSITLTAATWNTGVNLIVTGVDDDIIDGDIVDKIRTEDVASLDPFYDDFNGGDLADVEVTNQDLDVAGVVVTPEIGTTTEAGGTATFTFTLTSEPSNDVTIELSSSDTGEGTLASSSVTLTDTDWDIGVEVIVTGEDDLLIDGPQVYTIESGDVKSDDNDYDALVDTDVADILVTNEDDESAMITIGSVTVDEDVVGGNLVFTVNLNNPVVNGTSVTYMFTDVSATGGGTDYTGTPGTVIFLPNVTTPQTITVPINDDALLESAETFTIALGTPTNGVTIDGSDTATGTINDDDNCAPSPVLNPDIPLLFCGAINISLNDYISSQPPSGMVLTWSINSNPLDEAGHLTPDEVANPPQRNGTYYGFYYDADNVCASGPIEVELTLNTIPTIAGTLGDERCGPGEVILTATGAPDVDQPPTFNWYDSPTGGNLVGTGSSVTITISTITSFYVEATANGCVSERVLVIGTIYPLPSAGVPMNAFACSVPDNGPTIVDLDDLITGESAGEWSVTTDPSNTISIGIGSIVTFENRTDGDYVFTFTTTDATEPFCENVSSVVTISVNDCDVDTDLDGLLDGLEVTLGTNPNNADTDSDGIGDGVEVGDDTANPWDEDEDGIIDALESNILDTDMDGVVDQLDPANTDPCIPDPSSEFCVATVDLEITKTTEDDFLNVNDQLTFTITVTNISDESANLIQVEEVLDAIGFEYISHFTGPGDGVYDAVGGLWNIPILAPNESATLVILVEVVNFGVYVNTATILGSSQVDNNPDNDKASVEIEVNERGNSECGFLFNLFSPNGDGINDFLVINCITNPEYTNNSLEIYDRYGNQVFAARGYDNTWDGTRNNNDLPKGTYFYILDLGDGSEIKKGWIQIMGQ
jgi:gliding motility-associated-like protein/uncharacterized repeat protein (TIGR01451 family)